MARHMTLAFALLVAGLLHSAGWAHRSDAEEANRLVVAVLEPSPRHAVNHQLGFTVLLNGSKLENGDTVLDGLAQAQGRHLAILVHEDLPMSALLTVVSLGSKAGYLEYSMFVYDGKRKAMAELPGFKWIDFSTDPVVIGRLVQ